jgi:peptidyl-prolyl cis-trans isomerase B (cyclophilin B)
MITIALCMSLAGDPVSSVHLYNPVNQPVMVEVELPTGSDTAHIVLLNADGGVLAGPERVIAGSHNLLRRAPQLADLDRAAWLQLLVDGEAVGSPMVVQPMRSRLVPQTEEVTRGDGKSTYSRIVGWRDDMLDDVDDATAEDDVSLLTGWRLYPDRDVLIVTSEGGIRIALRPDAAPNTAWNFRELAEGGFYRNIPFHRIVPLTARGQGFVIQAGDPTGTGSGGPGWWLPIERSDLPHDFGVISMARANDPDSAGSQFFLCLSREGTARLDGQYCAFGETVEGEVTIKAIAATPLSDPASGRPAEAPMILDMMLAPAPARSPLPVEVIGEVDMAP